MAVLRAFKGICPVRERVAEIASRPYDVLDRMEAAKEAAGNPLSFLHVIKPEIDLPETTDEHAPEVYAKGYANFRKMLTDGVFLASDRKSLYIYAQTMDGRTQYGIVGCASVDDYMNNVIRKHELTRPDKEEDRRNHIRTSGLNYEPVFFAYPAVKEIDAIVERQSAAPPVYEFTTDDGIGHRFWLIDHQPTIDRLITLFAAIPRTYVADGHHRTAAAAGVGMEKRQANPNHTGNEEYNFFLAVHFPDRQLKIFDYNRVVKDLNGHSESSFLTALSQGFEVECKGTEEYRPAALHEFGMYLGGKWYALKARRSVCNDADPIGCLDVTVLSEQVLVPLLNITDLRHSKRIDFVGGIRGLGELKRRVDAGEMAAAFALYPVSMKQLINIADSGNIMPPKTTWFEPKLRSGLVVHNINE
ncbi:MAG: DUF1015 family protein [Bacteroidales bacterium]|jgi:uncharacterized protein (DUF1015 family)|nr:DUF1015 family protein [Bacteroidales bacterium]